MNTYHENDPKNTTPIDPKELVKSFYDIGPDSMKISYDKYSFLNLKHERPGEKDIHNNEPIYYEDGIFFYYNDKLDSSAINYEGLKIYI